MLVIDVKEGVQENSKRHGFMLSMLGIKNVIVLVNKMDLVDYAAEDFAAVVDDYRKFLQAVEITPLAFIPVSGLYGEGLASRSARLGWYAGDTVLEALDKIEQKNGNNGSPFRMFVQDVYKFTKFGDNRRIIAGTIDSGALRVDDEGGFLSLIEEKHYLLNRVLSCAGEGSRRGRRSCRIHAWRTDLCGAR